MTQEELKIRLESVQKEIRAIMDENGVWFVSSLYGFLDIAHESMGRAIMAYKDYDEEAANVKIEIINIHGNAETNIG